MKKLKKYTKEEIKILQEKYNALVKPSYKADWVGMQYVLADVYANQNLVLPYIEIGSEESINGDCERIYLEWATEETENKGNKMIKKYNLKTPITAVMWTGDNIKEVIGLADNNVNWVNGKLELNYRTAEGCASSTLIEIGDFVFKGSDGEYDCTDASRFNELFKEI